MANKVKFNECLSVIPDALIWAEDQDVEGLKKFFIEDAQKPLYCIASGGSVSPIDYAALLYESKRGMAKVLTPLSMASVSDEALQTAKILIMCSSGKGCDEKYAAKRASKTNPKSTCAIVKNEGVENAVVNYLKKADSRWFAYDWLTHDKSFIATIDTICKFGLIYNAFSGTNSFPLFQLTIDISPKYCFYYGPRVEGKVPKLQDIKNYIVLYNGWSRPVAVDFESKMVESGIASVQLCDFRNFCHGRFIFTSKHIEDTALVLFITPREQQFVKDLIWGITWRDKTDVFPKNLPILKVETEYDSPLATIDLIVKAYVLFDEIAKVNNEEPCSPSNPCKIDKRFPKNTPFK